MNDYEKMQLLCKHSFSPIEDIYGWLEELSFGVISKEQLDNFLQSCAIDALETFVISCLRYKEKQVEYEKLSRDGRNNEKLLQSKAAGTFFTLNVTILEGQIKIKRLQFGMYKILQSIRKLLGLYP
jgi:hypothetical protein